ncbi:MAG: hypothetical protein IKB64_08600 [Paludibacteraceae bacterium]|nr:hypothetical protein [Paludibacteraceae bacterium]
MFFLEDGRPTLYQWDLNRRIRIDDPHVTEVHFCNGSADCALVVKTYTDDTYDGKLYAEIPNILLQSDLPIKAYAYVNDTYTKECQTFRVVKRNQPSDYIYEETDILYASQVLDKADDVLDEAKDVLANSQNILDNAQSYVDAAEDAADEAKATVEGFDDYVEGHKLTLENDGEGNVTISGVNLSDLDYYTKEEVDALIPEPVDLTPYALKEDIPSLDAYATAKEVEDYINEQNFAYKTQIPTKVSQLQNDKGYLTQHQSLANYYTKQEVNTSISNATSDANDYSESLFNGANKALSFNNYEDMVTALNVAGKDAYAVGQNIMIVTLNVPDLWVSKVEETATTYSYTSDTSITDALKANGSFKVGYYSLSMLETQKVDLTSYATKDDVTTAIRKARVDTFFSSETDIDVQADMFPDLINTVIFNQPITSITDIYSGNSKGYSVQFKTGDTCTVAESTYLWIGDNCADGVFTPDANTAYEVYCYYNYARTKVVNMVMNLGAL